MRNWWDRLFALAIVLIAAGAIYAVWPDEPDRYLPDFIDWPSGRGVPSTILGVDLPCKSDDEETDSADCRGMTKGLDLQGGSRTVMQADVAGLDLSDEDIDDGLDAAKEIIESRINPFGVSEAQVYRSGNDRLIVELPGVSSELAADVTRPAVLMFCEPLQQGGQGDATGQPVGTVPPGYEVLYKAGTCEPDLDDGGTIAVRNPAGELERITPTYTATPPSAEQVVWTPGVGELNGAPVVMTGQYLQRDTQIIVTQLGTPILSFQMTDDGAEVFGSLTQRIIGLPLATFLDGEPVRGSDGQIIAPVVNDRIEDSGTITGLSGDEAKRLRTFLNNGAFPLPLTIVQQQDIDASLGDEAVRHSVEAGIAALLVIMAFMILYYRLPGLIASGALVVYTAVVLAIFKIGIPGSGPVTLTLAGIAAFVLSVGMAVDANILIFERTKEELRNGRSLIPSLEAGFSRAWTSIRDSNISTLITCAILWWMGNAFASSLIKGFALTLAIGVVVSMFSAITVTRTFMRLTVHTPLARPLWLWTDDKPEAGRPMSTRGVAEAEGLEHA